VKAALIVALALLLVGAISIFLLFSRDIGAAKARVTGQSNIIDTSFGALEFAQRGDGPPFLMIHGTGGGFDQGLTFTEQLPGFRVIAPSRFGYLRSGFPDDPSPARQADALVELLDRLNIDRLPVAGGSAGALTAAQFALRHPERTSALILVVPAANVRGRDPVEMGAAMEWIVRRLTTSDFLFWSATKIARKRMIGTLLATDPGLVENASGPERQRVDRILEEILPVSRRWRGMLNDARTAGNPAGIDFEKLPVPTLVISVEDDGFGTARTARDIAAMVPDAKLLIYPQGGHVWVGRDADLWREVAAFVDQPVSRSADMRDPSR
jgi:2-hydroxy-6-oxonona-2,4-dienedioate hydrolase